jgi:hypothetical protein
VQSRRIAIACSREPHPFAWLDRHRTKAGGTRAAQRRGQVAGWEDPHDDAEGRNALTALPAFKAFAEGVKDRCETPPVRVELTEIGSYGFFDE